MLESSTNLLTQEDRDLIEGIGFPIGSRPDLHHELPDGTVVFTIKGIQFYRAILSKLGMSDPLSLVRSTTDLYELKQRGIAILAERANTEVINALATGKIPAQRREVVRESLYGTMQSFEEACARLENCAAAGENVVPVNFQKENTADKVRGD